MTAFRTPLDPPPRVPRPPIRPALRRPDLTVDQILFWADAHHDRTGKWPRKDTGPVLEAPGQSWNALDSALRAGLRGLPGGSSLARLFHAKRGVRNPAAPPRLQRWEILFWADAHHNRTGEWPTALSGPIPEAPGETWLAMDAALRGGYRGLPGGDSLVRLLARRCGKRNINALPAITTERILAWADAHHSRSGDWPIAGSGAISDAPGETWMAVENALRYGGRGLPRGSSLAQLLAAERGVRHLFASPPLTPEQILAWADAHRAHTEGHWPTHSSGPVDGAPGETWRGVSDALVAGKRGLPGGDTLARFLARHRGKRHHLDLPPFVVERILAWAEAHHVRTGSWPSRKSGPIPEAPGEKWSMVDAALIEGLRGLPGGASLARLLARHRETRPPAAPPALSVEQIRRWVRAHFQRTGCWPQRKSGAIPEAPGETWEAVHHDLSAGARGLPSGSSLLQVVRECRAADTNAGTSARAGTRAARPR